jgi:hypothetical protein
VDQHGWKAVGDEGRGKTDWAGLFNEKKGIIVMDGL